MRTDGRVIEKILFSGLIEKSSFNVVLVEKEMKTGVMDTKTSLEGIAK